MSAGLELNTTLATALLENLPVFTKQQVDLLNFYHRCFAGQDWQEWLSEAFKNLFEVPAGTAIHLCQTNEIEPQEKRQYRFEQSEVLIGRNTESDVVLGVRAIGKQHARLFERAGSFYIEDLGSSIGTWLGHKRLTPGKPELLHTYDRFLVFPYTFVYEEEPLWTPADDVTVQPGNVFSSTRAEFTVSAPADSFSFDIDLHSAGGCAVVQVDREFLSGIVRAMTRGEGSELVDADVGIFEFIAVSVVNRLNRELRRPLQCSVRRSTMNRNPDEAGICTEVYIRAAGDAGRVRLFLPESTLRGISDMGYPHPTGTALDGISWPLTISAGYADLKISELRGIEAGDVLIYTPALSILLPSPPCGEQTEYGWQACEMSSNDGRLAIDNYFERNGSMEDPQDAPKTADPDFSRLPVRIQVVLGYAEMTLADLKAFCSGSIVELNRGKTDPVQLFANGKKIGGGRLVEVEGRLGVLISEWSAA